MSCPNPHYLFIPRLSPLIPAYLRLFPLIIAYPAPHNQKPMNNYGKDAIPAAERAIHTPLSLQESTMYL